MNSKVFEGHMRSLICEESTIFVDYIYGYYHILIGIYLYFIFSFALDPDIKKT